LAIEIAAVFVLAGFFMAAGWWLFDGRTDSVTPAPSASRERQRPEIRSKAPTAKAEPAEPVSPPVPVPAPVAPAPATPSPPPVPATSPPMPAAPVVPLLTFQRDILPILKNKCLNCHGDNKRKLKGGLDVSTVKLLEKGGDGGPALNRLQPELSLLWETVATGQMPPSKGNKLTESEKKKLHDWITGGAK
jgi:hypothetical protein